MDSDAVNGFKEAKSQSIAQSFFNEYSIYRKQNITHIFMPLNNFEQPATDMDAADELDADWEIDPEERLDHNYKSKKNQGHSFINHQTPQGLHWSLIVISLIDNVAFHYDSYGSFNRAQAERTVRKIAKALPEPRKLHFVEMSRVHAAQQRDGSSCGVFVCMAMQHLLCTRLLRANTDTRITMST